MTAPLENLDAEPLAKPTGLLLSQHRRDVHVEGTRLLDSRPLLVEKYRLFTGEDLRQIFNDMIPRHDGGKASPHWQEPCRKDYDIFLSVIERTGYGAPRELLEHELEKAGFGGNIRTAAFRHEIASIAMLVERGITVDDVGMVAEFATHGKLGFRHRHRWMEDHPLFAKYWKKMETLSGSLRTAPGSFEEAVRKRVRFDVPRGLLQYADHRASARAAGNEPPEYGVYEKSFHFKEKRAGQKQIEEVWDCPISAVRAAPGRGKTGVGQVWSDHQAEMGRADGTCLTEPTCFTATAMGRRLAATQGAYKVGLYHSAARTEAQFVDMVNDSCRLMPRSVVSTVDALCMILAGTREDHHAAFMNFLTACIILDEFDCYDPFVHASLIVLLEACKILQIPALIMSATLPDAVIREYAKYGIMIPPVLNDPTGLEDPWWNIKHVVMKKDWMLVLERIRAAKATIVYANTINSAREYVRWLRQNGVEDVVLYHSEFSEPDKREIEARLFAKFGEDAWLKGNAGGVAVMTQIGELSLNISSDFQLTELAPIDRMGQRWGRDLRFPFQYAQRPGDVYVVTPMRDDNFYPAPYGTFNRKTGAWDPNPILTATRELLPEGVLTMADVISITNRVYDENMDLQSRDIRLNYNNLKRTLVANWLITPVNEGDEEKSETERWRCRNIPAQKYVLLEKPCDELTWRELQAFQMRKGISVRATKVENAVKRWKTVEEHTIKISNVDQAVYVALPGCYDPENGLILDPSRR